MGISLDRSPEARAHRRPHLFLSHSSKDKPFVRSLAEHLNICGVDAWLDEWELQVGDSLYDVLSNALECSQYLAFVISTNFVSSTWAMDELKQALARERRSKGRAIVLPLLHENIKMPGFLEDRVYLDFRHNYYHALTRLTGMIHNLSRVRIEDGLNRIKPNSLTNTNHVLRYAGYFPEIIIDAQDFDEISNAGGWIKDKTIYFHPDQIANHHLVSDRVRNLMYRIGRVYGYYPEISDDVAPDYEGNNKL